MHVVLTEKVSRLSLIDNTNLSVFIGHSIATAHPGELLTKDRLMFYHNLNLPCVLAVIQIGADTSIYGESMYLLAHLMPNDVMQEVSLRCYANMTCDAVTRQCQHSIGCDVIECLATVWPQIGHRLELPHMTDYYMMITVQEAMSLPFIANYTEVELPTKVRNIKICNLPTEWHRMRLKGCLEYAKI
eukprot:scaffold467893_cov22-Prasinocladus_malaysianus.AAC.1